MLSSLIMRRAPALLLAVALCLAIFPSAAIAQSGTYTVQPGDRLADIAAAQGVSVAAIISANNIANPDLVRAGQRLIIPAGGSGAAAAPAAAGAQGGAAGTYTVQRGDTLSGIAARFGVSAYAIMQANNLASADLVFAGARLVIPSGASAAAAGGAAARTGMGGAAASGAVNRFVISISQQHCWLYQNGAVSGHWPCSTGRRGWGTATGVFAVQSKIPVAYGSTWDFFMPYWLGIYTSGGLENGIHGLPYNRLGYRDWGNRIGTPISFGCIVMQDAAARAVYNAAYIGMPVVIQP